jgi:hypothetical protein
MRSEVAPEKTLYRLAETGMIQVLNVYAGPIDEVVLLECDGMVRSCLRSGFEIETENWHGTPRAALEAGLETIESWIEELRAVAKTVRAQIAESASLAEARND